MLSALPRTPSPLPPLCDPAPARPHPPAADPPAAPPSPDPTSAARTAANSAAASPPPPGPPRDRAQIALLRRDAAKRHRVVLLAPDCRDKVLVAIVRALMLSGNTPATPKELVGMMLAWGLINMGGETPQTVVSSRISQHFRRCAESEPPRKPVLGAWTGLGVRKLRYFVDAPGIPVPEVPKWRLELTVRLREEGDEGKPRPKKAKGEAGAKAAKAAKLDADYSFWGMVTAG